MGILQILWRNAALSSLFSDLCFKSSSYTSSDVLVPFEHCDQTVNALLAYQHRPFVYWNSVANVFNLSRFGILFCRLLTFIFSVTAQAISQLRLVQFSFFPLLVQLSVPIVFAFKLRSVRLNIHWPLLSRTLYFPSSFFVKLNLVFVLFSQPLLCLIVSPRKKHCVEASFAGQSWLVLGCIGFIVVFSIQCYLTAFSDKALHFCSP